MASTRQQMIWWLQVREGLEQGQQVMVKFFWSQGPVPVSGVKQGDWGDRYLLVPNGTVSCKKLESITVIRGGA